MPKRQIPTEVLETAAAHGAEQHDAPFPASAVGRPRARPDTVRVTWGEDPELGQYITCRDCRDGFDRYLVEVEREQPTERLLALVGRHFACAHPEIEFSATRVWHVAQLPIDRLATFMPMVPQLGASIICARCPQGMNHPYLTPPPYGDARRLALLLREQPEVHSQTRGFTSREQAEYLEARDRGALPRRDSGEGLRALKRLRAESAGKRPPVLEHALTTIMRERVAGGEKITPVIKDLDSRSKDDATGFACLIGAAIPALTAARAATTDEQFAHTVVEFLGAFPTTSERGLWRIWQLAN